MASAAEMAKYLNRRGLARLAASGGAKDELHVPVEVLDARYQFGRTELLVTPLDGGSLDIDRLGQAWVNAEKVVFEEAVSQPSES